MRKTQSSEVFKHAYSLSARDGKHTFKICSSSKLSFWTREQVDADPFKSYFYIETLRPDFMGIELLCQFSMLESAACHMFTVDDDDKHVKLHVYYPYEHKPAIMRLMWWTDTYSGLCDEHAVEMPGLVELSLRSKHAEDLSYYDDVKREKEINGNLA